MQPALHHLQPWAKPKPPWASLAGWLLSAPQKAAQKALKLGLGQQAAGGQGWQVPLGVSLSLEPRLESLMETLSKVQLEAQLWSLVSKGTPAGVARTAQTSTQMMREPPPVALRRWKGWTWICVRMKGRGPTDLFLYQDWNCYRLHFSLMLCDMLWSQGGPWADSGQKNRILQDSRRDWLWKFLPCQIGNSCPDQRYETTSQEWNSTSETQKTWVEM